MANRIKGEADIKIGDKTYTMCYDHSALIELEDQLDKGIVAISSEMSQWKADPTRIRLKWIRALLYVALRKHHRNLTIDDVTHLMEQSDQGAVMDAIGTAMSSAFGSGDAPAEDDARPTNGDARSGTGGEPSPSTSPTATTLTASGGLPPAN